MVSQKEIIEELRGECNGCKRDMLADRIEAEGIAPKPYVPMTDYEREQYGIEKYQENAIIAHAGLEVKHD